MSVSSAQSSLCQVENDIKHDDNINPHEVSFVIEFTRILMKQMIEQFGQGSDDLDNEADVIDALNVRRSLWPERNTCVRNVKLILA